MGEVEVRLGELGRVDAVGNLVVYPGNYMFDLDVGDGVDAKGSVAGSVEVALVGDVEDRSVEGGKGVVLDLFPQPKGGV